MVLLCSYVFLRKSFISVECSGIFLMSSQSLSVELGRHGITAHHTLLKEQITGLQNPDYRFSNLDALNDPVLKNVC